MVTLPCLSFTGSHSALTVVTERRYYTPSHGRTLRIWMVVSCDTDHSQKWSQEAQVELLGPWPVPLIPTSYNPLVQPGDGWRSPCKPPGLLYLLSPPHKPWALGSLPTLPPSLTHNAVQRPSQQGSLFLIIGEKAQFKVISDSIQVKQQLSLCLSDPPNPPPPPPTGANNTR